MAYSLVRQREVCFHTALYRARQSETLSVSETTNHPSKRHGRTMMTMMTSQCVVRVCAVYVLRRLSLSITVHFTFTSNTFHSVCALQLSAFPFRPVEQYCFLALTPNCIRVGEMVLLVEWKCNLPLSLTFFSSSTS